MIYITTLITISYYKCIQYRTKNAVLYNIMNTANYPILHAAMYPPHATGNEIICIELKSMHDIKAVAAEYL